MSSVKEILSIIENMKRLQHLFTDNDVISILKATRQVSKNKQLVNNLILLYKNLKQKNFKTIDVLTSREQQILHLIGLGNQSNTIAKQLGLSVTTVETHRKNIRKKLNLTGNGKLLEFAIINNLQQAVNKIH